ncbi:acyl-CoA dehydrogenase family protein [Streptomyces sp. NPDC051940]|uniref:acyl-CoA dehydrogenase family protein n=1 Tax=Streptomyces sp. NPDC051940 TaxID=3155675 RepID=UPI00343853FD
MRFTLSAEQRSFAEALDSLLGGAGVPATARAWAAGDHGPGRKLWSRLAGLGVTALRIPEASGGVGGSCLDVAVAFEQLGRHAVPGPWIETAVLAPALPAGTPRLDEIAAGELLVSVAAPPHTPRALDADTADRVLLLDGRELSAAAAGKARTSMDPTRRLFEVVRGEPLGTVPADHAAQALDAATLACAAMLLGAGERLLAETVAYAGARRQFGRVIGEYQAVKHALADVRVRLDFARPLVHGAALELEAGTGDAPRDVSAAKVACSDAAYLAARTALQIHGAIGYTLEFDLSLWLLKVRALRGAWGTPAVHRARVLDALTRAVAPVPDRR